ncbi:CaiB/BaiF CoA transferase family protein [Colwelliaceae bacterium BS250]
MSGPLSNLKVLDLSSLLPGPYATMLMADMGAEILRIEAIGRHDLVKSFQPSHNNSSYSFLTLNRNKQAIALDLKQQAAVNLVKKLVLEYDVVVEQFRPGVMAKLGLDFATLSAINPKLIYCSITGFGQQGCYKSRAGHDINYLALSGLSSFSGTEKSGPVLSGTQIADIAGGSHHAVMGILAAVIERNTTNKGQHLDISMTDSAFALTGMFGAGGVGAGIDPTLGGTILNGGHFYDYYKTKDNRYLSVGSLEPKFAQLFFANIGNRAWFTRSNSSSQADQIALKQDISDVLLTKTLDGWMTIFDPLDACVEPVLTVSEAAKSTLMSDREMIVNVTTIDGSTVQQIAPAVKFESSAEQNNTMYVTEPTVEYTQTLLSSQGYSQVEIDEMLKSNAVK